MSRVGLAADDAEGSVGRAEEAETAGRGQVEGMLMVVAAEGNVREAEGVMGGLHGKLVGATQAWAPQVCVDSEQDRGEGWSPQCLLTRSGRKE